MYENEHWLIPPVVALKNVAGAFACSWMQGLGIGLSTLTEAKGQLGPSGSGRKLSPFIRHRALATGWGLK